MGEITIRQLCRQAGDVVDRVAAGERLIVSRHGRPVAKLRPARPPALDATELLRRWRSCPTIDAEGLRRSKPEPALQAEVNRPAAS